jgi:hypothetical protein
LLHVLVGQMLAAELATYPAGAPSADPKTASAR